MTTLQYIVAEGSGVSGVSANVSSYPLNVANSVNPVWRKSIYSFFLGLHMLSHFIYPYFTVLLPPQFLYLVYCLPPTPVSPFPRPLPFCGPHPPLDICGSF